MAENNVHPGSWIGDSVEEFKKLPTAGKVAAIGALVAVAGIGLYEYRKNAGGSSGSVASGVASSGNASDPSAGGGMQSPFSQVPTNQGNGSSVPVIPFGDAPIFDGQGNLIGWQQPGGSSSGSTPASGFQFGTGRDATGLLGAAAKVFKKGGQWFFTAPGETTATAIPVPAGSRVYSGNQGRWWYEGADNIQYLLTSGTGSPVTSGIGITVKPPTPAPKVTKPPTTRPPVPLTKLPNHVVQHGDTLSGIASREHVNGGWQALYNANKSTIGSNPNVIKPGQKLIIPR